MPSGNKNHPLPFPLEELRTAALDAIINAMNDLNRMNTYYRGHRRDARIIEIMLTRLLSLQMTLAHLEWDSTCVEDDYWTVAPIKPTTDGDPQAMQINDPPPPPRPPTDHH